MELFQLAGSLGGIGGLLALVVVFFYRQDRKENIEALHQERKDTLEQLRNDRIYMEDRLTKIIMSDQESRDRNTRALTELSTIIERISSISTR